eukprot:1384936-Amorphochlora_amoeboformis.AAC.1
MSGVTYVRDMGMTSDMSGVTYVRDMGDGLTLHIGLSKQALSNSWTCCFTQRGGRRYSDMGVNGNI